MYLKEQHKIWLGGGDANVYLEPAMANRHGLIAGATGTGKTVTLKVLAEDFSEMGVPVFIADVKGDLSGMYQPGCETKHIRRSIDTMGLGDFEYRSYPVHFWDVFGDLGLPVRTTVSEMGPELLSRLLDLNDTQSGVLRIVFRVADDNGLLLIDLKDLRSMLVYVGENADQYKLTYGNVTSQSIGAIQRALLKLEDEGGNKFFGEPALSLKDFVRWSSEDGRGIMNILECRELFNHPLLYSTFLLWMLTELYELLPEAGDLEKPKLVFFFDEAHLLFDDAPKALIDKVEQVVRLIRSKGVSVWFITQNPTDIPDSALSQIGNRVQHALRAYTPNEQKAITAAAKSFRSNEKFDTAEALQALGTGEALLSVLDADGIPTIVERAGILPPHSSMSALPDAAIRDAAKNCEFYVKYAVPVDNRSAYEVLTGKPEADEKPEELTKPSADKPVQKPAEQKKPENKKKKEKSVGQNLLNKTVNSAVSSIGRTIGNKLARGLLDVLKF